MKRIYTLSAILLLLLTVGIVYGAMTYSVEGWRWNDERMLAKNGDLHRWAQRVEAGCGGFTINTITGTTTLTAAQSGQIFVCDGNSPAAGNVIVNLPTAVAGLVYTVVDANATADDDVYVKAAAADTINGGTAAQYIAYKTDSGIGSVTLVALDATRWSTKEYFGTWAADDTPD